MMTTPPRPTGCGSCGRDIKTYPGSSTGDNACIWMCWNFATFAEAVAAIDEFLAALPIGDPS